MSVAVADWVVQLAMACTHRIPPEQRDLYVEEISKLYPTDDELDKALGLLLAGMADDKRFPNLGLICVTIRQIRVNLDKEKQPGEERKKELEWMKDACSREDARQAFMEGLMQSGMPFVKASAFARGLDPVSGLSNGMDMKKSKRLKLLDDAMAQIPKPRADYDDDL